MTQEQKRFLNSIGINPDMDLADLADSVSDYLQTHGISDDALNEIGTSCLSILDYIGEQ